MYVVLRPFPGSPEAGEPVEMLDQRRADILTRRRYIAPLVGGSSQELEQVTEELMEVINGRNAVIQTAVALITVKNLPDLLHTIDDAELLGKLLDFEERSTAKEAIQARIDELTVEESETE